MSISGCRTDLVGITNNFLGTQDRGAQSSSRKAASAQGTADASLFRASLTRTINDLQIHVRPLSTGKVVDDTSNAGWNCGLVS